jgi:threonyl-tRNA synthetase
MRLLLLHADKFSYVVTGDTSITAQLDPIPEGLREGSCGEALVCMLAVEKGDAEKVKDTVDRAARDIEARLREVKADTVMLYPYAHLSSSLEAPRAAVRVLDTLESQLKNNSSLNVVRAPFGVYKGFEIKVKGHPLSELGRTITAGATGEAAPSQAVRAEDTKRSEWFIYTPDGDMIPCDKFDFRNHEGLEKLIQYEMSGSRLAPEEPPHIQLMQEHELVDYEPGSDQGNFRWYPKGYLLKKLLEDQINFILARYGAMQVETPIMYDAEHPALAKYLDKFPARQYILKSEKKDFFLRFAACFGQYLIKHDMQISYRHLPVRLYELTHYSFRREQSGELAGLRRLRTFTMPDMHTLCRDMPQAKEEMLNQVRLSYEWMKNLGFNQVVAVRAVREYFDQDSSYVREIAKGAGEPILLELWDKKYFYFITKFECNVIDSQNKAAALSTVQIDVENPEGFGITYVAPDNSRVTPLMLHTSVSGSIDRNVYALLEQQAMKMKKSQKATFPFWLAPTQIRLIPVSDSHVEFCESLAGQLSGRVDIDDRGEKLGKKIRDAEREWIPLIIVIGDKEVGGSLLPVRVRDPKQEDKMTVDDVNRFYDERMTEKAFRPLNLPVKLSQRPTFRG